MGWVKKEEPLLGQGHECFKPDADKVGVGSIWRCDAVIKRNGIWPTGPVVRCGRKWLVYTNEFMHYNSWKEVE